MWRLKIGEGSNDPYLFSTNNFAGRQTWVFDPEAGTPEERAEVEEARQNFYKNRRQVRASSDLIWRMQVPFKPPILLALLSPIYTDMVFSTVQVVIFAFLAEFLILYFV